MHNTELCAPLSVRHMKTGNIYQLLGRALDCTNVRADDNVVMVLYAREGMVFVREEQEFWQKFERIQAESNDAGR